MLGVLVHIKIHSLELLGCVACLAMAFQPAARPLNPR